MGWYENTYRKLFFDFHSHSTAAGLASRFDAERWAERVRDADAQAVSVFTKGAMGWSFYRKGQYRYVHPHLPNDLDMVETQTNALHRRGIKAIGYYHTFNSEPVAYDHPEWVRKDRNGKPNGIEICMLSPLAEEWMLPQIAEITQLYDLDALFFDGTYAHSPCYCDACRHRFLADTGLQIPESETDPGWRVYVAWMMKAFRELRQRMCCQIHQYRPDMVVSFNWAYTMRQPETVPADVGSLMADIFPQDQVFNGSYQARHWVTTGVPFDIMNTAFLQWWGDWGCKPAPAMQQEVASALANGGLAWVGYQMDHQFDVQPAVMAELAKVMSFIREREHLYQNAEPVSCIAVLNSTNSHETTGKVWLDENGFLGLHRILVEGGFYHQFVDENTLQKRLSEYQAVILPDQMHVSPNLVQSLERWVNEGGVLIAEGLTGTLSDRYEPAMDLQLADLLGVHLEGQHKETHAYIVVNDSNIKANTLDMPHLAEGRMMFARPRKEAHVLAELHLPYLRTDGEYLLRWSPVGKDSEYPAITKRDVGQGCAIYMAGQFFRAFHVKQQWNIKNIIVNLLENVLPKRFVECRAGELVEVVPTRQNDDYVVHLVNYQGQYPIGGGRNVATERIPPVRNISLRIRLGYAPSSVRWEPSGVKLNYTYADGIVEIEIPELHIHGAVVIKA